MKKSKKKTVNWEVKLYRGLRTLLESSIGVMPNNMRVPIPTTVEQLEKASILLSDYDNYRKENETVLVEKQEVLLLSEKK